MPACTTPELWPVWWTPTRSSRSSTRTPRSASRSSSSRATASPRMPAPTTARSQRGVESLAPKTPARGRLGPVVLGRPLLGVVRLVAVVGRVGALGAAVAVVAEAHLGLLDDLDRLLAREPAVDLHGDPLGLLVDREEVRDLVAQRLAEVLELLDVVPVGSCSGTQTTLSSTPLSSRIRNSAMIRTGITHPGNVGSLTHTIASSGSPPRRW